MAAAPGTLIPVAGTGETGFGGDGGQATAARFAAPSGVAVSGDGILYIADTGNHRVRAVAPGGLVSTVAGDGGAEAHRGPVPPGTAGTSIALGTPTALAAGPDGTVYIADNAAARVYALGRDRTITIRADLGGRDISALAATADGGLYVADRRGDEILFCAADGTVRPVLGPSDRIRAPVGLAVDVLDDLWIAADRLYRLRSGTLYVVTESSPGRWEDAEAVLSPSAGEPPSAVAARGGFVYAGFGGRVLRLGPTRLAETLPGPPGDGPAPLAVAPDRTLYLADTAGARVLAVESPEPPADQDEPTPVWVWPFLLLTGMAMMAVIVGAIRHRDAPPL
ncbi:hypothetical protein GCM10010112_38750 [Actinoplanes lobatus]|nr:hypothetical protein GCM10010112_38750 [Actinoplanes lobatus]GIE41877.1 hypothetical protein Alo02nite_47750 [Actinoplanes lobatus]